MPRVSIIIPVRDQAAYLAESLTSAFGQHYRDVEVIVIDDGSREDVGAALAPWAGRLRLERQSAAGVAAACNRGAAIARGEILAFHDADDVMEPERIALPLARLDADAALALVFGNGVRITAGGQPLGPVIPPRQARRLVRRGVRMQDLLRRSLVYLQASVIRRAVFQELGGLPPFTSGADWGFVLRCALRHPVAFIDAPLFRYRQHPASLTAARVASSAAAVAVLRDFIAREPAIAERLGKRRLDGAVARRLARLAAQELRAGDPAGARLHLGEACALVPWLVKYRLRLWRLGPRASP
jgi:glycosyltransferase involved in cell wall biosynthesis